MFPNGLIIKKMEPDSMEMHSEKAREAIGIGSSKGNSY